MHIMLLKSQPEWYATRRRSCWQEKCYEIMGRRMVDHMLQVFVLHADTALPFLLGSTPPRAGLQLLPLLLWPDGDGKDDNHYGQGP